VDKTGRQVLAEMRALSEVRDARIKGDLPRPEIVHPRLDIAAQLGVSVQSISETIRIATLGDLPQNGAKFSLSDRQIPIRVSLIERAPRSDHLGEPARADGLRRQRAAQIRRGF
jgi:multidrug efflux pump subunit AcrB